MEIKLIEKGICQIKAETNEQLAPIRNYFKTENSNKFFVQHHNPQFNAPDFIYGISATGYFKIGLLTAVLKVMIKLGIEPQVDHNL